MTSTASSTSSASAGAGAGSTTPHASASLYVGDLSPEVTEALLFEVFNAVGPVASVRVCRDAATRRSLGYAYVNMHQAKDAEKAMNDLNYTEIRGRMCRIMWSHRDPSLRKSGLGNIFIKNLAKSIDHRVLYETFVIFGTILSCKVANNSKGESLGYGFVHYESDEAAAQAIAKVDGKVIAGEKVSVAAFKSKRERGTDSKQAFTNLYVKFLPTDYNKEKLEQLFAKYGTVTSAMIAMDEDKKANRGFGFVNMASPEEASAAVEALNNLDIGGKKLFVTRAQKKEERERDLRNRFEKLKLERASKYPGINLYIKNLADEVDDERLRKLFAPFGEISSARVMRDQQTQKSKGFGFVSLATQEEATKAVTEMNNKMVDDKPLYVALAQKKEMRRAQLEARRGPGAGGMGGAGGQQGQMQPYGQPMYFGRQMYPGQMQMGGGRGQAWMMPGQAPPHMMAMPYAAYGMMPGFPQGAGGRGGFMPGAGPGPAGQQMQQQQQQGGGPSQRGGGSGRGRGGPARGGATSPQGAPRRGGGVAGGGAPAKTAAGGSVVFDSNVRNQQQQAAAQASGAGAGAGAAEPAIGAPAAAAGGAARGAPLTIKALAAAPEKQKKQMIGEQLFPRIRSLEPALAGKITGMLLEMDNGELIHLLESGEALAEKVSEAKDVLQQQAQDEGEAE